MIQIQLSATLLICILLPLIPFFFFLKFVRGQKSSNGNPVSYPIIGSFIELLANKDRIVQWETDLLKRSPTSTIIIHRPLGEVSIVTANPSNVQHILKTRFDIYQKGELTRTTLSDLLGHGIFNVDGDMWKFQRQISSHEFNTKSLRNFVENVVDIELNDRLIPILSAAAANQTVLDFQDILQRFAFDNICKIAFGYDPAYLLPSLPQAKFAVAFEEAVRISSRRFGTISPLYWKVKRLFNVGSEETLKNAVAEVREFAGKILREKKQELNEKSSLESVDLLSRFLSSGHSDENFVIDIVISFILAGRDTTSAALTWFFWLVSKNSDVENEILKEVTEKSDSPIYDEVKDMIYTHASLCESMRLYPPVPSNSKEASCDDVLPDGTVARKGFRVTYVPYAMGRMEELWGANWAEFRPERWLESDKVSGKRIFVGKDAYTYPVFQAGPRICLGKEMAFLQMKRVVAGVLQRFKVVPAMEDGLEPVFVNYLTSKMKGGFPVRIIQKVDV